MTIGEYFTILIKNCKFDIIKDMIKNLQSFLREFVTKPESGDNRYILQSSFHNRNVREGGQKRGRILTPEYYGWPKNLQICINELYKLQNFINFDEFQSLYREKTGKSTIAESSFLKFKNDIQSIYGKIDTGKRYPPPIQNKKLPPLNFLKKLKRV